MEIKKLFIKIFFIKEGNNNLNELFISIYTDFCYRKLN